MRHAGGVSLDDLTRRFLQLRTEESGSPVEWTASSGTLGSITTLAAFSWCFFLEAELDVPAGRLPAGLVWITDALEESLELRLVGQDGYELGSLRRTAEESGVLLFGCSGRPIRENGAVVRHWAKARYWCWPLPPDGVVSASMAWPSARIDESLGAFDGESLRIGAERSVPLDMDMRNLRSAD